MLMATSTRENGRMTKPTAKVCTLTLMDPDTKANGLRINNTDMVLRDGQTVHRTRDNTPRAKSTEEANSRGLMPALSQVTSKTTTFTEAEFMNGLTEESTLETGKITRWKVMVLLLGLMAESM